MGEVVYGSSHYKSVLGILKVCEVLVCLLAVILVAAGSSWTTNLIDAFYAGTITGIIVSVIILILSSTEAGHSLNEILRQQFITLLLLCIYNLVVSSILVSTWYIIDAQKAGGAFGLIAGILYFLDAEASFKSYGRRFWIIR